MGAGLCTNSTVAVINPKPKPKHNFKEDDVQDLDEDQFIAVNRQNEQLWRAVQNNNIASAAKYLDFNEFLVSDLYDSCGQTMLHKAASIGAVEILMLLIDRTGANPDLVNGSLATPLHIACRNNQAKIVKFLIGCGVDVNQQDEHGQSALLICCIHGNLDILKILIEASTMGQLQEPLEIDLSNHQGLTPLNCAAIRGDYEMVKCLVNQGNANVNQTSPKGCTPLIYSGRGGYYAVVEYLLQKKASPLQQDNAGGTILHHALEKGHLKVLETMIAYGVDVYSALEICDNEGRTPLFESIENLTGEDDAKQLEIVEILTRKVSKGGFGANPNVINNNGQTPLFIAARLGSMAAVALLVAVGAQVDLNNGEQVKESFSDDQFDQAFIEAYNNCMTPLQVAIVLGYDDVALYLAQECQADVNLKTNKKGFTCLHLSVLSNKPEMVMDLLRKTNADPMAEDSEGRTLLDMIYKFMPLYAETFQAILVKLEPKKIEMTEERLLQGLKSNDDITKLYQQTELQVDRELDMNDVLKEDLGDQKIDVRVEQVFGTKLAMCLLSQNWEFRQKALQLIQTKTELYEGSFPELLKAVVVVIALTCRDKVIKVFCESLNLFNLLVQSPQIENKVTLQFVGLLRSEQVVQKLLSHSETSSTRVASKIHEALLDLSYLPQIGEDLVVREVYSQIRNCKTNKGLMAQLALLYKLVSSFSVQAVTHELDDPPALNKETILAHVLPAINNQKEDVRKVAQDIVVEVQKQTGVVLYEDLDCLSDKLKMAVWNKLESTLLNPSAVTAQPQQQSKKPQQVVLQKDNRELVLTQMLECLSNDEHQDAQLLGECLEILQISLSGNNIQVYLQAIEVYLLYVRYTHETDQLAALIQTIVLKTSDSNTRVRKLSMQAVNTTWVKHTQVVSNVILDPELGDKAIEGRLGLLLKKAMSIESSQSLQDILRIDYDKLTQFACCWCTHKDTKVRQCALKLIVEICRLNDGDPVGKQFKQRITGYILGLRHSIRDPLVKKINTICKEFFDEQDIVVPKQASYDVKRQITAGLPQIVSKESRAKPTIVLPHSEPLQPSQIEQNQSFIDLLGQPLMTCFLSQTWSSRFAALQKVKEQVHNLDPRQRDPMNCEINKSNMPPEVTFKTMIQFFQEGLSDPVLKNYVTVLELVQFTLPIYFRYLKPEQILKDVSLLTSIVLNKLSDLKQKVRFASTSFCLYLSHQIEIGADQITKQVLDELNKSDWDKQRNGFQMITSCLDLLAELQQQSNILAENQAHLQLYLMYTNKALKHQNPQVRQSGESLFQMLHGQFGESIIKQINAKLKLIDKPLDLNNDCLDASSVQMLFEGQEDILAALKSQDAKARLYTIIEIKKIVQHKLQHLTQKTSRDLVEPLTILLRHFLKDQNVDVFIQAIQLLKFVVGNLAPHLSQLDLHLMMGQLIYMIVIAQVGVKGRIASDKCIVYFAKHPNVGSLVVAKEILKNIRLNKNTARFYGLLLMMVQQFSIVLCYNSDFYNQLLDTISETLIKCQDDQVSRSIVQQLIIGLNQIDSKLLENYVQKLEINKKGVIKRVMIEQENSTAVKGSFTDSSSTFRDTQFSFGSSNKSTPSSGFNMTRRRANQGIENETPVLIDQCQTGSGWLERKDSVLPPLVSSEKRQVVQSYVGSKAAGFNRSEFNSTGEYTRKELKTIEPFKGEFYVPTLRPVKRQLN